MFRTFVAIELPESLQKQAARIIQKYERWPQYRWVRPDNLHLTLSFLGDVPESEIATVCGELQSCIQEFAALRIHVQGLGAFPKPDRPRVIWLGVTAGSQELAKLQRSITQVLKKLGFDRDRNRFHPHFTLGRLRKDRRFDDQLIEEIAHDREIPVGEFRASQVIVFASFLEREGPTYTPLARIQLR